MKMKKSLSAILTVFALLVSSCSNWMKDDDFYNKIENDVKVANAASVNVYVRYANSKMGSTEPSASTTLKVDIPADISAVTSDDYGFVKWAAFSTKDFPTSRQHSNLFYESEEKYTKDFKALELPASEVSFTDPKNPTTTVKIYTTRSDIFITPLVAKRPEVVTSVPSNGRTDVVKNSQIRILFSKPIDETSLVDEFGNSNVVITSGSAVLTENSSELGAKDITENFDFKLSKTKKMLTISAKKNGEGNTFIFDSNSQISINIYEDVCDTDGFTMNGKKSFSFTTGTKQDSLAPYIEKLTAGIEEDCKTFVQYNYPADYDTTGNIIGQTDYNQFEAAAQSASNNLDDYKNKTQLLTQRVKDKINIYVRALDIAGSGGSLTLDSNNQNENDVALIQIRASQYINQTGTPVTTSSLAFPDNSSGTDSTSVKSVQDIGYAMGVMDASCKIKETFETLYPNGEGTIFTYDLSDPDNGLDDGLIKIDLWAVDMVGNSGDSERYSSTYGNGIRSIFVVKDSTAPDAAAAKAKIQITSKDDNGNNPAPYSWFNSNALSHMKIKDSTTNPIKDLNNEYLSSDMKKLEWAFKLGNDTSWKPSADAAGIWSSIHDDNGNPVEKAMSSATVSADGPVYITMCLKDDLGNVSAPVVLDAINYDNTAPLLPSNVSWVDSSYNDIVATTDQTNLADSGHILKIPFTEEWAGLRRIKVEVNKNGSTTSVPQSDFSVSYVPQSGSERSISFAANAGDYKTFDVSDSNKLTTGTLYISGIKIGSETGSYKVTVDLWDSSLNKSTTNSEISIDTTAPVIKKVYIPGLKQSITATQSSGIQPSTQDGWFLPREWVRGTNGATSNDSIRPGFIPLYIFVNEKDSGIKKIDFYGDHVILFNSASTTNGKTKLYKIENFGQENERKIEIPEADYTVETKAIILNDNKTLKSSGDFVILVENAGFDSYRTGVNNIKVRICDLATLASTDKETISPYKDINNTTEIAGVLADSYFNISNNTYTLIDRGYDDTNGTSVQAQSGFTNEDCINLLINFKGETSNYSANSRYNRIKITGAKFTDSTKVTFDSTNIDYELSADKTEMTFIEKNNGAPTGKYVVVPNGAEITISDLQLDSDTDGVHTVKINVYDLAGWGWDVSPKEETIVLDKTPPKWVGKGLYTGVYSGSVAPAYVYPHPTSDGTSEGLTLPGRSDLYFYRSSSIRIDAKITEQYPILDDSSKTLIKWTGPGLSGGTDYAYMYGNFTGDFTANVYDKAGNKSEEIAFHIEYVNSLITSDDSRKDIKTNLENEVQLIVPEGADLQKNTFLNGVRSPEGPRSSSSFDYYNEAQEAKIWVFNYMLKQFDGKNYQLKVPVHSYAAGGEKTVPIEQYGVSHQYTEFPSTADECAYDPFTPRAPNWHDYKANTSPITDGHLSTKVDENGDILITLPNHNCPPVSLWLKDACGNTEYILLNPGLKDKLGTLTVCETRPGEAKQGKRNQAVAYVIDNRVGVNDSHNGTGSNEEKTYPTNTLVSKSDISFYKKNSSSELPELKLNSLSDSCRFPYESNYNGLADLENNPSDYTLKSKIIVWQGSGKPAYEKFYDSNISGSAWYAWKEFYDAAGAGSAFTLKNNFPEFDNAAHDSDKYELWYIIEDRVGNYEVRQIKNGSKTDWLYDVTPPKLDVKEATNVNNIEGKNYYSNSSSVKYSIEDKQSGIQHDGASAYDYSSFASRVQLYPESGLADYSLNGVAASSGGTISISGVKDWAENEADSVGLENAGSTTWVKLGTPNPSVTLTITPYKINQTNTNSGIDSDLRTARATNITKVSDTNPFVFKAMSEVVKINVDFNVTGSEADNLLGWVIKDSEMTDYATKFYSKNSTEIKQELVFEKKKSGKWDKNDSWPRTTKYCYPVNKAGIVGQPITVTMELNQKPMLKDGTSLTYSPDSSFVSYTNSNSTEKINFIKSSAKVNFTSNIAVTKAKIVVYEGDTEKATLETSLTASSSYEYSAELLNFKDENDTTKTLASYLDTPKTLKFMISTVSENSSELELKYPSTNGFNNWAYDATSPAFSFDSAATEGFVNVNSIYYFNTSNPELAFSIKDSNGAKPKDIKGYEYKVGSSSTWADVPAEAVTGPGNQNTDCTVKIALNSLQTMEEGTAYTFYFRAVDKAGNYSSSTGENITVQKDTSAPDYSSITHSLSSGTYVVSSTDSTKITFNPNSNLNVITIGWSGLTETGVGFDGFYYTITAGSTTLVDTTKLPDTGKISLSAITAKIYTIVLSAKDLLGNTRVLRTFYAHGTAPSVPEDSVTTSGYSGLPTVPTYPYLASAANETPANWIKGIYEASIGASAGIIKEGDNNNKVRIYTSDKGKPKDKKEEISGYNIRKFGGNGGISVTSLKLPVDASSLPGFDKTLYYAITYNSIVPPAESDWATATISNNSITVEFDSTKINNRHSFLFVWYKDAIGNKSVYNIGVKDSNGYYNNWWTTEASLGTQVADPYIWIDVPDSGIIGEKGSASYSLTATDTSMYEVTGTTPGDIALGSSVSIKYQPTNVTKINISPALNFSVGINKLYYTIDSDANQVSLSNNTNNSISLPDAAHTYKVYALDNNNNTKLLLTYSFVPDAAGPEGSVTAAINGTENSDYVKSESGNTVTIKYNHAAGKVTTLTLTPGTVTDAGIGLADTYLYYKIGENGTETQLTASGATNITLDNTYSTYIVYAKDKFGNSTELKRLVFVQDATAPGGTIGWLPKGYANNAYHEPDTKYYTIDTTTEAGTIILTYNPSWVNTIEFKDSTVADSGVGINDSGYLYYSVGDSTTATVITDTDSGNNNNFVLNIGSVTVETIYTITAHDQIGNPTAVLLKFKLVPTENYDNTSNNGGGNGDPQDNKFSSGLFTGLLDTSKIVGSGDLAASQISAMSGRGIIMNKDLDSSYISSSTTGQSRAAKKAARAAKKAAKKAEKASAKTAKEKPLVQEFASQIEDLGITEAFVDSVVLEDLPLSEQIIKEDISQVTAKTDFVMSPIEKVEIADTIQSDTSSAAQAQQEKSSSKAALIVVMLAILSALAGAWYLRKGRK